MTRIGAIAARAEAERCDYVGTTTDECPWCATATVCLWLREAVALLEAKAEDMGQSWRKRRDALLAAVNEETR